MTESQPRRPGRPRDQQTHEAILVATRELLLERGYPGLTIDSVAARARTAKTTIYRRWSSKGELVIEAAREQLAIGVVPDTGNTRRDLEIAVGQLIRTFSDRLAAIVMLAVIANLDDDPALSRRLRSEFVYPWRSSAAAAIRRGVERGDLAPETDPAFVLDVVVGTVFQRTVINAVAELDGLDVAIVDLALGPGGSATMSPSRGAPPESVTR